MIRIAKEWDADGVPTGWDEYPKVHIDQVPPLLGMRFDQDLAELHADGLSLGVKRWTEVVFWLKRFSAEAAERVKKASRLIAEASERAAASAVGDDADLVQAELLAEAEAAEFDLSAWMAGHERFELARQVSIWAAVNLAGRRMSLLEVLSLRPADVQEQAEPEEYIDDDELLEPDAGKA